jgi:tetratricopeptide (TPR) repeat protein
MRAKQRSLLLLAMGLLEIGTLLGTSQAQATSHPQLRYKVYYQCNGERVQVDHCRKDDDSKAYGPLTKPQENYCLVYYPDRPRRGGFIMQSAELYDDIVKKLQACGALAGAPAANPQTPSRSTQNPNQTDTASTYLKEGEKYYSAKDFEKSGEAYKKAIAAEPTSPAGYIGLADAYVRQNQRQLAIDTVKQCIAVKPANIHCWSWLGGEYLDEKRYHEAFETDAVMLNIKPDAALMASSEYWADVMDAHYWMGWIALGYRRPQEAVPHLQQAIRFNADPRAGEDKSYLTPYASALLGEAYMMLKQYQDAAAALETSIRDIETDENYDIGSAVWHSPDAAKTCHLAVSVYLAMGKKDDALKVAQRLRKVDQQEAEKLILEIRGGQAVH